MGDERRVAVESEADVITARETGRRLAEECGFDGSDLTMVATAISEIARNVVTYAERGEVVIGPAVDGDRVGIGILVRDEGPGIPDVDAALGDGYSTGSGLGLGLPGARRLMDDFEIESAVGEGTTVAMRKWRP